MMEFYAVMIIIWFLLVLTYAWYVSEEAWCERYKTPDSLYLRILGIGFLMFLMGVFLGICGN